MKSLIFKVLLSIIALLLLAFFLGPTPNYDKIDLSSSAIKGELHQIDSIVNASESKIDNIKPENAAEIIWHNNEIKKTEYAVLYLHGFTASHMEGNPIHKEFAKRYGCNLYLSRLEGHGVEDIDAFKNLTPDNYFESAQKALEITKKLGNKIIVMSCSTGSTLSILLAKTNPEIHSFIMFSPNIDIRDPMSALTVGHWGKELTEFVLDGEYNNVVYEDETAYKYWYKKYHINGIIALKKFIVDNMISANFKLINQPLFLSYYYKNENEQDDVVSVKRMIDFYNEVSTPAANKRKYVSEDAKTHIISSSLFNKNIAALQSELYKFAEEVLKLPPIKDTIK
jgi:esterase/lipase